MICKFKALYAEVICGCKLETLPFHWTYKHWAVNKSAGSRKGGRFGKSARGGGLVAKIEKIGVSYANWPGP